MTEKETRQILALLASQYKAMRELTPEMKGLNVSVWFDCFKDVPVELVRASVSDWIKHEHFAPTIGDIYGKIEKAGIPDSDELWKIAASAIRGNKRFDDLPSEVQRFFGNQSGIDSYGFNEKTNMSVVRALFMKELPQILESSRTKGIKDMMLQIRFNDNGRLMGAESKKRNEVEDGK